MAKNCQSCVFFNPPDNTCRHHAPDPALAGSPAVVWPRVDPMNDWCAQGFNTTDGFYDTSPAVGHA